MKTNKRKIATILLVVVFFSFFPSLNFNVYGATTYTGQTEVGDYSISNMSQLVLLSEKVNSGTSYEGSTFTLLSDLYHYDALSRGEYIPIGNLENPFSGTFDGNGFKIRSLNMELASAEESYYTGKENNFGGIFGNIENAIIKNLTANYNTLYVKEGPPKYIGAIAGKATSSLIDNCHATGRFEKSQNDNTTVVGAGGLVGVAVNTRINNSTNSGFYRLRSWIWYDNHYSGATGGIVGKIEKNSSISIPSFVGEVGVFNCTNNSRTDSRSEEYHYDNRTSVEVTLGSGGIAYSVVNAKIENCVNNSPFIDAGIVYSASSSEINFSINNGYSSQGRYDSDDRDYSSYGRNRAGIAYSMNNSTMLGCINYGEISTNTRFANRVQRRTIIAGLVYSATDSLIKKSANYGLISINAYSRYSTVGGAEAGGLVGYANNTTIDTCYNTGDVLVYYDSNTNTFFELYYDSYYHVGGIVAKESGSTIKNTYSSGDIRNNTYYYNGDRIYSTPYGISGTSLPITDTYFLQGSLKYTYRNQTNERPYPGGSISLDKSSTFMQSSSFLTLINNNTPDNPYIQQSGVNNGYPIFKFLKQLVTVKINGGSEVGINSSLQLTAESNPSDSYELEGVNYTWESSNPNIATIDTTGKVTGVSSGTTTITLTGHHMTGTKTTTKTITVIQPVTSIVVNGADSMYPNSTIQLSATVYPTNAGDKSVTWSTSNSNIATVSSTGEVTGKAKGTVTIRATANDGSGVVGSKTILVYQPVTSITIFGDSEIYIGSPKSYSATAYPTNADDKSVTWSTSNSNIATVSSTGEVTGKAKGTVTIRATANDGSGIVGSKTITIKQPVTSINITGDTNSLTVGSTLTLNANILPTDANDKSVTWSSNNENVVIYPANNTATIRAIKEGTVVIKAIANDVSGIYDSYTININPPEYSSKEGYILVEQPVEYITQWSDTESDPLYTEHFKYSHNPNYLNDNIVLDNDMGIASYIDTWMVEELKQEKFTKVGTYDIEYKIKDNPSTANNVGFENYRYESEVKNTTIYVHRKPRALFSINSNTVSDFSYDLDHENTHTSKGIERWEWTYINDDGVVKSTTASTKISGETTVNNWISTYTNVDYKLSLKVQDIEGAWSDTVIKSAGEYSEPVADFYIDPSLIKQTESVVVTDRSYDTNGLSITSYEWTIKKGTQIITRTNKDITAEVNNFVQNITTNSNKVGTYEVTLVVTNEANVESYPVTKTFEVRAVNTGPTANLNISPKILKPDESVTWGRSYSDPDIDNEGFDLNWTLERYEKTSLNINGTPTNTYNYSTTRPFTGSFKSQGLLYGAYNVIFTVTDKPPKPPFLDGDEKSYTVSDTVYVLPEITLNVSSNKAEVKDGDNVTLRAETNEHISKVVFDFLGKKITLNAPSNTLGSTKVWETTYIIPNDNTQHGNQTAIVTGYNNYARVSDYTVQDNVNIMVKPNLSIIGSLDSSPNEYFITGEKISIFATTFTNDGDSITSVTVDFLGENLELFGDHPDWDAEFTIPEDIPESGYYDAVFTATDSYGSVAHYTVTDIWIEALRLEDFRVTDIVNHSYSYPLHMESGHLPVDYKTGYYVTFRIDSKGSPTQVKSKIYYNENFEKEINLTNVSGSIWEGKFYTDANIDIGNYIKVETMAFKGTSIYNYNSKESWNGLVLNINGSALEDGRINRTN